MVKLTKNQCGDTMQPMIFAPFFDYSKKKVNPHYEKWLNDWLENVATRVDKGITSSSECIQGALSELMLYGRLKTDWHSILSDYLRLDGECISYSEGHGKLLWNFDAQWQQSTVHAVYYDWCISKMLGKEDEIDYVKQITKMIQPSGWIFNPVVSPTQLRTRMKSELLMSMEMGIEILRDAGEIQQYSDKFISTLVSFSPTGYLSAEYFKIRSLELLNHPEQITIDVDSLLNDCLIERGYHDYCIEKKTDDYMGTKKRTQHDKPIASPLISTMAKYVSSYSQDKTAVIKHVEDYASYLSNHPMDIQAFRMRDIEIPFGTSITPFEIIAASTII